MLALATPASVAAVTVFSDSAHASTALVLTLKDLVGRSDAIVVGMPKSRTSRWEGGRIVTYTVVAIDTAVAGAGKAGDTITVRTLGGIVDGIGQIAHGEAVLKLDAPLILFLQPVGPTQATTALAGSRSVVGMSQGSMPVTTGTDKVQRVGPSATDLTLLPKPETADAPKDAKAEVAASAATAGRSVSDVLVEVRALWAARAKK